jgi:hypothetical protein
MSVSAIPAVAQTANSTGGIRTLNHGYYGLRLSTRAGSLVTPHAIGRTLRPCNLQAGSRGLSLCQCNGDYAFTM